MGVYPSPYFLLAVHYLNGALEELVKEVVRSSLVSGRMRLEGEQRQITRSYKHGVANTISILAYSILSKTVSKQAFLLVKTLL